jgi:hypothetical protein
MSDHGWQYSILQGIGARIEVLAELYPRLYLLFMAVFALLGYACLLLFPLLTLAGLAGVYRTLVAAPGVDWLSLLMWLLVAGSCGLVSYRLFLIRPYLPAGVVLDRSQAPALFQLVEETAAHYSFPAIDCIVITGEYQLDIVNTPVTALPPGSMRSLLVGLPLLQCLSTTRFQCALARRLGQHSRRTNRLLNWLYTLRSTWPRYREPAPGIDPAYLPLRVLFSVYAALYTVLSTAAARLDELQADSYAMELFSDEDVLDAITADAVYRLFLRERYWPVIRRLHEQDATVLTNAPARMATVLNAGLQAGNVVHWIEQAMAAEQQWDDPWPLLVRRLENIGHAQACMSTDSSEPPAAGYLATIRPKLEAALADLSPPKSLQVQPLPARLDGLRRRVQSATHGLLRRLKNVPYPGEPMDRGMHS